jgi:hypothetical protein
MDDDDRRAYAREQKARRREQLRLDALSRTETDRIADRIADRIGQQLRTESDKLADRIVSELRSIVEQISGATHRVSPQRETPVSEGAPTNADKKTDNDTRTRTDSGHADAADTRTDPLWEFDDEGRVRRYTETRGDDPTIPERTWPDPRRTAEHAAAADNGITNAREALDRNRWHPTKGPR